MTFRGWKEGSSGLQCGVNPSDLRACSARYFVDIAIAGSTREIVINTW